MVEQQLNLSLDREKAELTWIIAPPAEQAGHILVHLDRDGDGTVTDLELSVFVDALLAATTLTVNGKAVALTRGDVTTPDHMVFANGKGAIEVTAIPDLPPAPTSSVVVSVKVRYAEFAKDWFIQPFYFGDLTEGVSTRIEREPNALSVTIPFMTR